MSLAVIGAGYPRTGASSLKSALETLGFGPVYHLSEVFKRPDHWPLWIDAADERPVDWERLFDGYRAVTDAPGCLFYRQIAAKYPAAKVILTLRDPEQWFASTQGTIFAANAKGRIKNLPPLLAGMMRVIGWRPDDPATHDKSAMIARLNAHNEEVKRVIPANRLLVHELTAGWEPLCKFLDVPVPDAAFPHVNRTADFQQMVGETKKT
jgi:hypothetical protein